MLKFDKQETKGRSAMTALFDAGTFVEMGAFIRRRGEDEPYDAIITGYGSVEGKLASPLCRTVTARQVRSTRSAQGRSKNCMSKQSEWAHPLSVYLIAQEPWFGTAHPPSRHTDGSCPLCPLPRA